MTYKKEYLVEMNSGEDILLTDKEVSVLLNAINKGLNFQAYTKDEAKELYLVININQISSIIPVL